MAGVGDFVLGNLPDLTRQQRDDGKRFAGERHEFDGAALAALVNEHDRADVVLGQAMLRQVGRQHHAVEFFDHNQISNGYAVANVAVSVSLAMNQTTRTSGERPSGAASAPSTTKFRPNGVGTISTTSWLRAWFSKAVASSPHASSLNRKSTRLNSSH